MDDATTPPFPRPATAARRPRLLVLVAHPQIEQSRLNRRLVAAVRQAADVGPLAGRVELRDLYALYPDYLIDAQAEQAALLRADLIVWQHPIHWYGPTPLLKLWFDEVLAWGWAYGPGGEALHGKHCWVVASTGGSAASYRPQGHNRRPFEAFLPPYEQTAVLCGLQFEAPWIVHGAARLDAAGLEAAATHYIERLAGFVTGPDAAE